MSSFSPIVFDQGSENSCVANAICQAIRLESREYHLDTGELARNQIYYDYRFANQHADTDTGAGIPEMLDVAKKVGIAAQANAAPYNGSLYLQPSASTEANAATQKVIDYKDYTDWLMYKNGDHNQPLANGPSGVGGYDGAQQDANVKVLIEQQLMQGKAVIVDGDIPEWLHSEFGPLSNQLGRYDQDNSTVGRHAFLIVGKDDTLNDGKGAYIVENSWGTSWGDRGYGTLPYDFIEQSVHIVGIAVVQNFKNVDTAWTQARSDIATLYVGTLGRAVDHSGLEYWVGQENSGVSLSSIANALVTSGEAAQKYGSLSSTAYVDQMYMNLFGRHVVGSEANVWVNELNSGVTRGNVTLDIIHSAQNSTGTDHDALVNRGTVSETYAATYQLNNSAEAATAIAAVTSNADTVQVALTGVQHDMGWMAATVTTYSFTPSFSA
ncbi:DUF4214 domain-containing protein [Massilia rhizosphaerae]|uniref:DUF4214 domain-containing protein n=1 Tax=Massilia rhizosphaerae TaxID=2784389 RepID=UPI0018DD64B5|nr:DUF4214 domain-containing protein [Massilia rhizosphaerae]